MKGNSGAAKRKFRAMSPEQTRLLQLLREKQSSDNQRIKALSREDASELRLPASRAQQRLWFIDQLEGGSAAYHIAVALRLRGTLDVGALQSALDALIHRHESLRTVFEMVAGELQQVVLPPGPWPLEIIDRTGSDTQEWVRLESRRQLEKRFNLQTGPLVRALLLRLGADEFWLQITLHHIIADGWSLGVLARDLSALYTGENLTPLNIQYADYSHWQRSHEKLFDDQLTYWRKCLTGAAPHLNLPTDHPRPSTQSYRGDLVSFTLDSVLCVRLRTLAQQHDMTLFMLLYAGWALLLARLSGQDDIVIGTPVANRPHFELESLVGLFVNTLVLRVRISGELRVAELLEHIKQVTLGASENQDLPLERLVELLKPQRSLGTNPLFQSMLVLQNTPEAQLQLPGLTVVPEDPALTLSMFDLSLSLEERGEVIEGSLTYATDLFDRPTVERWAGYFSRVLEAVPRSLDQEVADIAFVSEEERWQVLHSFNDTERSYPADPLVHELFERQALRTPDAPAVIYGAETLTFAELNVRANRVAWLLRKRGIQEEEIVGLFFERSAEMLVAILGVWKAGGAYLPLDVAHPAARLNFLIHDAAIKTVLTQPQLSCNFPEAVTAILLDELALAEAQALEAGRTSSALAYVIYTSGSTGEPKGVMVEHRNVVNHWRAVEQLYRDCGRIGLNAPITFDASVQQIVQLLSGRTICVVPQSVRVDASGFLDFIRDERIDGIDCTPSQLNAWISAGLLTNPPASLRTVLVGGEAIDPALWAALASCKALTFYNVYGPTECTVDSTAACVADSPDLPLIGRPLANAQIYVLDERHNPAPIGVPGEIYIGGAGLTRGYINRPQLTEERFREVPLNPTWTPRLYRTGDVARWHSDGTLEYLGRNDSQVKIRGFRIELGEIEAQLSRHPRVADAVVTAREDVPGDKYLAAYIVPEGPSPVSADELRSYLKTVVPDYMIPRAFTTLAGLPMTASGKIDRRALPAPDSAAYSHRIYEEPRGEIEVRLAALWRTLLGVDRVGRLDHFFELGGHSLLIVKLMDELAKQGMSTQVRQVFEHPVLADLAAALKSPVKTSDIPPNLIAADCAAITPEMLPLIALDADSIGRIVEAVPGGSANIQDIYPLAPLQAGILFHHLMDEDGADAYARPILLSLPSEERLSAFLAALQSTIDRHDVLRTAVFWEGLPQPVQVVLRRATLPVEHIELNPARDSLQQLEDLMRPEHQRLNLNRAPLLSVLVASAVDRREWYALVRTHHLVCDNESQGVLLAELRVHLTGQSEQLPAPLPYRNHVARALAQAASNDANSFFRSKLSEIDEPTAPFGVLEISDVGQIRAASASLDSAVAPRLRTQARRLGVSATALFHAAWALVVAHASSREDVVFGTVLLGRLQDGERGGLGMFINTLPLRLRLSDISIRDLVQKTQHELTELFGFEQTALADAQRCSGIAGSAPLFSTLLNYRHSQGNLEAEFTARTDVRIIASRGRTSYPILLSVDDFGADFGLEVETDQRIDPEQMLGYVSTALGSLADALESSDQSPALSVSILSAIERRRVLEDFNATAVAYPSETLVHQLFEDQVRRTPDAVALKYAERPLSYAQLNARANQLARHLRGLGVAPDTLVGVCLERSLEVVVGLLGILKAGGAYVPLDPDSPIERLQSMLDDCLPKVVLTQAHVRNRIPGAQFPVLSLDTEWAHVAQHPEHNLNPDSIGLNSRHLAYVIYTSGSTGKPKGAMNEHRAVVNRVRWMQDAYGLSAQDRVLQKTPYTFDVSVWEFFWTLMTGAELVIARPGGHQDPTYLTGLIRSAGVTTLHFVPSMLQVFLEHAEISACASVRHVVCSGEELPVALQDRCLISLPRVWLSNLYGPTEAAVDVTAWECVRNDGNNRVPIGRPISNIRMYVLDRRLQPVPVGVSGEIHIGGIGVGRGYLNRPELTNERFIRDPFSQDPTARMYKTGDLGHWRPDGALEYLGRDDHQIKIRGLRIELGEIEAHLLQHPYIKETVVVAREDSGEKRLIAYVVADESVSPESLRSYLKARLPEHMVPSGFVTLDKMPLSPNGKLDRRALPAPDFSTGPDYDAPQGEIEQILANIWEDLLKVKRVGRRDHFFTLGGHSLLVVQMRERLRRVGLTADLRRIFDAPTLADLASVLTSGLEEAFVEPPQLIPPGCQQITPEMLPLVKLSPEHIARITSQVPGGASNIEDIYPLAPLQEGILFHRLMQEDGIDPYLRPMLLTVSSRGRLQAFTLALQTVVDRHAALRSAVMWEDLPRPIQVVYRAATIQVHELELTTERDALEQMRARMSLHSQHLEIRHAPLIQLHVAEDPQHSDFWYVLFQTHHLVCDAQSIDAMLLEVAAHLEGRGGNLPPAVGYRRHVAQALASNAKRDSEAFFRQKLADMRDPTAPFGLKEVHGDSRQINEASQKLDATLSERLRKLARQYGVTAATLFHSVWALVLSLTTGRDDVVFGTVLLGRMQADESTNSMLGMFINTLPLRLQLGDMSVRELVETTQRELVELLNHEQCPLAVAQRCSGVPTSTPLFSTLLNYRHAAGLASTLPTLEGIDLVAGTGGTNYPISISVDDLDGGFEISAQTDERLDPNRLVGYMNTSLQALLNALEQAPGSSVASLTLLPESERSQVTESFNSAVDPFPENALIQELIAAQARRTPDSIAIICEETQLTYVDLDNRADDLARLLRSYGVGPDERVVLYLGRSEAVIVAMLAVLKAGGAYVPLDTNYPAQRIQTVLHDCAPVLILTEKNLEPVIDVSSCPILCVDTMETYREIEENPRPSGASTLRSQHLAYLIYTSGSTGQPKAVMVAHRNVVNIIYWQCKTFNLRPGSRCSAVSAFGFDAAVLEIWPTLATGATLVLASRALAEDPSALLSWWAAQELDVSFLTTSLAELALSRGQFPTRLRALLVGGDTLHVRPPEAGYELFNVYGPTEITVLTTAGRISPKEEVLHIGKPITNTRILILDQYGRPSPIGVPGEIFVGGAGVARGYFNRPALTAERFVSVDTAAGERLYRTGDLGKWRPDGTIEFIGRNDGQVKIRGFRVECGEIEQKLALHERVRDAVVVVRDDQRGDKFLAAYVIASGRPTPEAEELRTYLKDLLPAYMVPSAFVTLDRFPLAVNGKVNRRALPSPDIQAYVTQDYEPPQGEIEGALAEIWDELLGLRRIGRNDNFFELGGHSLLGVQLVGRVSERLQVRLTVPAIFQNPTVQKMATWIEKLRVAPVAKIVQPQIIGRLETAEDVPLSFSQLAHWSLLQLDTRKSSRHIAWAATLSGDLDISALRDSVAAVVRRQEALRVRIRLANNVPVQVVTNGKVPFLEIHDLTPAPEDIRRQLRDAIASPIDASLDPLFAAKLLIVGKQEYVFVVAMDHLISDAFSRKLLVRDIFSAYQQLSAGQALTLSPLPISFSDYCLWQRSAVKDWIDRHAQYGSQLERRGRLRFPSDPIALSGSLSGWAKVSFDLGPHQRVQLQSWCRAKQTTPAMACLAVFSATLLRWCQADEGIVLYQTTGRADQRFEQTIGYFAAVVYLDVRLEEGDSFLTFLERVTEQYCIAHEHADYSYLQTQHPRPEFTRNSIFNFIPFESDAAESLLDRINPDLQCTPMELENLAPGIVEFDSEPSMLLVDGGEGIHGEVYYPMSRFEPQTLERFARTFVALLEVVLQNPETKIR